MTVDKGRGKPADSTMEAASSDSDDAPMDQDSVHGEDDDYEDQESDDSGASGDGEAAADDEPAPAAAAVAPEVYLPGRQLNDDEELVVDESAYVMFHQAQTGDPCLSFDVIADRLGENRAEYPLSMYLVAGTQSAKANKNSVIVLKISNLHRNKESGRPDDDADADDSDGEEEQLPELETAFMKHAGCVNRIRATSLQGRSVCATWSEMGSVHVWDLTRAVQAVDDAHVAHVYARNSEDLRAQPLFSFSGHQTEGFALDWSPVSIGSLATGDCRRDIHVWRPHEAGTWHVDQRPYTAHTDSVEDIQWSPNEAGVLASCSVDKSIRVWDVRASASSACMLTVEAAHDADVNVISWSRREPFLVSGGDDGKLCVWDVRSLQSGKPVAVFKHHTAAVTTVQWNPSDGSQFASGGADDQIVQWDLSVESDGGAALPAELADLPPQLLFIHQGQREVKELHWHPQIPGCVVSTAHSGFNIFRTISV